VLTHSNDNSSLPRLFGPTCSRTAIRLSLLHLNSSLFMLLASVLHVSPALQSTWRGHSRDTKAITVTTVTPNVANELIHALTKAQLQPRPVRKYSWEESITRHHCKFESRLVCLADIGSGTNGGGGESQTPLRCLCVIDQKVPLGFALCPCILRPCNDYSEPSDFLKLDWPKKTKEPFDMLYNSATSPIFNLRQRFLCCTDCI
jgi:hypothetical protein